MYQHSFKEGPQKKHSFKEIINKIMPCQMTLTT